MNSFKFSRCLALVSLALAAAAASAQESDSDYAKRVTAEAVPGCASGARTQLNLSAEAATSMCTCAFKRMFSENPIKDLPDAAGQ